MSFPLGPPTPSNFIRTGKSQLSLGTRLDLGWIEKQIHSIPPARIHCRKLFVADSCATDGEGRNVRIARGACSTEVRPSVLE